MKATFSIFSLASAAALAALLGVPAARAGDACREDAKGGYKECRPGCTEGSQVAKDACLDRDAMCIEVCRAARDECRAATGIDAAIAACNATLAGAKQTCRSNHPAGSPDLDQCIDQAQVVAFECRLSAKNQRKPALAGCRSNFKLCARGCAPNAPPNPDGVAECKLAATQARLDCKASCRESRQVLLDACLNRDHACVEQCRAERDGCAQPVAEQLARDIADCNATRDAAIQSCNDDQCIINAQVTAFECRDQSRENAWASLNGCRWDFRMCAAACPPAS